MMNESMYLTDHEVVMNFDLVYPETKSELLRSDDFKRFVLHYFEYLKKKKNFKLYNWLLEGHESEEAAVETICRIGRELLVFDIDELEDLGHFTTDSDMILSFVEGLYNYWRKHERYAITTNRRRDVESTAFVANDSTFNQLIISTFRRVEEMLMRRRNHVFRQQQAGTNASICCYKNDQFRLSDHYNKLKGIYFIDSVMLRTPMILHPRSNKREWPFEPVTADPIESFDGNPDEFFCFPAKVGKLTIFIYFHRDYMANGVSCANLFELALPEEVTKKPDCVLIFGNPDGKDQCGFYYDEEDGVWVGSVSANEKIEYFGYMKKMVLTLHNVAMMQRGWLPIHGAFIDITLHSGKSKGICLMGDSGAGKSETIEALKNIGHDKIRSIDIVFDDMGSFHIADGKVYAEGTETGAFVRLDDLDPGTPYRDINRSIFFNPDLSNSRVITPAAPYSLISTRHEIDLFAYANNYGEGSGLHRFEDLEEAKDTFIRGKRMAKGTTQEVGLSETYFANPFGPMQQQDICRPIIDDVFQTLQDNDVFIGEVFTHLGRDPENRAGIEKAAEELLQFIEEN